MIIKILDVIDLSSDRTGKLLAIENLLKAHAEGKHRLWMPVPAIKSLSKCDEIGVFSLRVLDELFGHSTEERQLHRDFLFFVQVDFFDKYILEFKENIIRVGYQHFADSAATQEAVLLTENELDGDAYLWGAKNYLDSKQIGVGLAIDVQSGGGNTTYNRFSRLNSGKRFFACIVDSDRDHPSASLGSTARRFNAVTSGFADRRYLEILPCHEIENIIPVAVVREVAGAQIKDHCIFDQKYSSYRLFIDHKEGLTLGQARQIDRLHGGNYFSEFDDFDDEFELCPRLGSGLLELCLGFMSSLSRRKSMKYVDEAIDKEWIRLSKIVASWGVGGRGLRS